MFAEQISKLFYEIIIELLLKEIEKKECLKSSETEIKFRLKHGTK